MAKDNYSAGSDWGAIWTTGVSGNVLSFDGINDYVTVPDSNSLDITSEIYYQ